MHLARKCSSPTSSRRDSATSAQGLLPRPPHSPQVQPFHDRWEYHPIGLWTWIRFPYTSTASLTTTSPVGVMHQEKRSRHGICSTFVFLKF